MFNRKSDYALNKKNMASIVYKDAYDCFLLGTL